MMKLICNLSFLFFISTSLAQSCGECLRIIKESELGKGITGFSLISVNSKETTCDFQGDFPLIPASTWKVPVAYYAYKTLGSDYRFKTELLYTGEILGDGTLTGDLIIRGGGDPSLGAPHYKGTSMTDVLDQLESAILKAGIKCIDGRVITDASIFRGESLCPTWPYQDIGNYYAAGSWGLNIHGNYVYLDFDLVSDTVPILIDVRPSVYNLSFNSELTFGPRGSGDQAYIYGAPLQSNRIIRGTLPKGIKKYTIKGSLPSPPTFLLHRFLKRLNRSNVQYTASAVYSTGSKLKGSSLLVIQSDPLKELLKFALKKSDNTFFESFFRLSANGAGYSESSKKMRDFFRKIFMNGRIEDGSGLSPWNRCSAEFLAKTVALASEEEAFIELLPNISETSLNSYVKLSRGNIKVKSGFITGVVSYTGLITRNDEKYAFAIIYNGVEEDSKKIRRAIGQVLSKI